MNFGGTIRINRNGILILIGISLLLVLYNLSVEKSINGTRRELNGPTNNVNMKQLLLAVIEATRQGGKEVFQLINDNKAQIKGKTKEGADEKVTKADFNSHCVMFKGLQTMFPNIKIISEEGHDPKVGDVKCSQDINLQVDEQNIITADEIKALDSNIDVKLASSITVWIDPLDATQEYTEKLTQYVTVMACVAIDGTPVIGVIHNPFQNTTSWAWVGRAASKDLQVKMRPKSDLKPKIIVSRSHTGDVHELLQKAFGSDVEIINAGGAGYKSLQVAHGNVTAYIHKTAIKKWDICAGNAIINFMKGQMTTFENKQINYSNAEKVINDKGLVATLSNHDLYIEAIQKVERK